MAQEAANRPRRSGVRLIAALGVLHLAVSLALGGMCFAAVPLSQGFTTGFVLGRASSILWPYLLLFVLYLIPLVFAKRRRRLSAAILALALVASAALCVYDLRHDRFRITAQTAEGPKHFNPVWWWQR